MIFNGWPLYFFVWTFSGIQKAFLSKCVLQVRNAGELNSMEGFLCLVSMKYSQINTKPCCTPRKLIWELTQQSAQPEAQNSAGTRRGEVNWGRGKPRRAGQGATFACGRRTKTEERVWEKAPWPKSSWRESGKVEIAAGTDLKRETGERRGFKFR